jgi:hypothetical protein
MKVSHGALAAGFRVCLPSSRAQGLLTYKQGTGFAYLQAGHRVCLPPGRVQVCLPSSRVQGLVT